MHETIDYAAEFTGHEWIGAAATKRGLCWMALGDSLDEVTAGIRAEFPAAHLHREPQVADWIKLAVNQIQPPAQTQTLVEIPTPVQGRVAEPSSLPVLDLRGTDFQLRVWKLIRAIPRGETRSYRELACALGSPRSSRAIASSCASNRIALLIPCHRVIGSDGTLKGYRWGTERKRRLLEMERASL